MTIIEMHELCDLLLDKANSPWFSSKEKDSFLNLAHEEFVQNRYNQFELDERTRKELIPLVKRKSFSNTSEIKLDSISDFMYALSLQGEFKKKCGSGTKMRKISPIQLDDELESQEDPFNVNDDENPGYTEENNSNGNVLLILSDNSPSTSVLKYLKRFTPVHNDELDPSKNVNSELPDFTHEDIVYIAVRKMMATTEQQLNYQLHQNEINNQQN